MLPGLHAAGQQGREPLRVDFLVEYHGEGISATAETNVSQCKVADMFCSNVGPEMNNHPPFWNQDPICSCQDSHNNTYWCLRTLDPANTSKNWMYCEFESGFAEFYDIQADPWQRQNQIHTAPADL